VEEVWAAGGVYAFARVLRGGGEWYGEDSDRARWAQRCVVNELSTNRVLCFASDDRMRRLPTSLAR
jgi:hypothetical protein